MNYDKNQLEKWEATELNFKSHSKGSEYLSQCDISSVSFLIPFAKCINQFFVNVIMVYRLWIDERGKFILKILAQGYT